MLFCRTILFALLLSLFAGCVFTLGLTQKHEFPRDDPSSLYRPEGNPLVPPNGPNDF